jgi:large repetitive protein
MIAAAVIGGVLLLGAVGAGIAIALSDGDDGPAIDTVAPVVEFDQTPGDPTEERSASFEFSADEDVDRFECSLDGDSFAGCSSPRNIEGPLSFGEHSFAVRAFDLAGNRGKAETFSWTVERGEGPTVTITDGPESLTKETTARFEFSSEDAVRFECHVDDNDFERCTSPFSTDVDEGDHVFVVRGVDANGATGAEATHEWTVDTTGPTVEIDNAERTSTNSAAVEFTPSESEIDVGCALFESNDLENAVDEKDDCSSPVTFTNLDAASTYVVRITATDAAGNAGEPAEADIDTYAEP